MKLIYVAGPYTGKDYKEIEANIKAAEEVSIELIKLGWAVITPHKNFAHYETYEGMKCYNGKKISYQNWIDMDIELLSRCDAILMMKGWRNSKGSVSEHTFAQSKTDTYYEEKGLPEPWDEPHTEPDKR